MTVQESNVEAGGFTTTADEGNIKLVRYAAKGKPDVVKRGINDRRAGSGNHPKFQDRDNVLVETNKSAELFALMRTKILVF
jgi:hypothetical protein